jgi:quercetin dioxygenase-like cupin family protein
MSKNAMKYQSHEFLRGAEEPIVEAGEGVTRQNLGYDDTIFMARVFFEKGSEGYLHAHPHSQTSYVESGVFDFTVGSETQRLIAGDGTYIPPGVDHGAVCIEEGVLLDVFSPVREDFLPEKVKNESQR